MRLLLLLILSINLFAQEKLTIVAVGEAERSKDKIYFKSLKGGQSKLRQAYQIVKDDFAFYKHLFELEKTSEGNSDILVEFKASGNELSAKVISKDEKKTLMDKTFPLGKENLRAYAHNVANEIYQSIRGKESIFKSQILFASDKSSTSKDMRKELYMMDFDGKNKQQLTYEKAMIISPAISPDNSKILFTSIESKWQKSKSGKVQKIKNPNLYSFDLKTRRKTLISDKKGINSGAVFTSNPDKIYLTLSDNKNSDIYEMNLKTKSTRRVTSHYSDDVDPHINKDGSLMTFLSGRSGKAMIYTLDPSGKESEVKRISYVGRFNSAPRFSPDGKQIVFSSWVDNRFDLYKIDSDGKNLVRLTKSFGSNEEPWFSPDGEFIVFTSQKVLSRKKAIQDVYIINREGEKVKQLTTVQDGKSFTPRWTN